MLDQYAAFVNEDGCNSLGDWILRQREKNLTKKANAAAKVIRECRVPIEELRHHVSSDVSAASRVHTADVYRLLNYSIIYLVDAPVRLRRELDKVLGLQTQIDAVEQSIIEVKKSITGASDASPDSLGLLRGLETTHETLSTQAKELYTSLNIHDTFPELKDFL
ncbi:hypothetical protein B0H13DRAFT_2345478 [Mycena leptocephala]|nr:hypothetical protein B0H13DRAFT_2345478 [Mycena leptocephala]